MVEGLDWRSLVAQPLMLMHWPDRYGHHLEAGEESIQVILGNMYKDIGGNSNNMFEYWDNTVFDIKAMFLSIPYSWLTAYLSTFNALLSNSDDKSSIC